jgi:putative addiction module killer protein
MVFFEGLQSYHLAIDTPVYYTLRVPEIRKTKAYTEWIANLRDRNAVARIDVRIRRLSLGNAGDFKSVGEGVSELRIDHGPGYRVYFQRQGELIILLLIGGDERSQDQDIRTAKKLAKEFGNAA